MTTMEAQPTIVRWAFMATGGIARTFARDLLIDPKTRGAPDLVHQITAVASSSSVKTAKAFIDDVVAASPRQAGTEVDCKAYGSYEEMLKDDGYDLLYIATPHSHHFQNCMLALEHQKNVVCEKPLTVNREQAHVLYAEAKRRGCFLMEAVWTRFFPLSIKVRELVRARAVGEVLRVFVNNSTGVDLGTIDTSHRYLNKDLAGGALLDIGVYALTWLFQILYHTIHPPQERPEPENLLSLTSFHRESGTDQMISIMMDFKVGDVRRHGIATASMILPDAPPLDGAGTFSSGPTVHIYGLEGEIQVFGPAYRPRALKIIPKSGEPVQTMEFQIPGGGHGMFWEADAAARSWKDGQLCSSIIPWEESLCVLEVMDNIRRQAGIVYPEAIETTTYPLKNAGQRGAH